MNFRNLDLNLLRIFDAVMAERSLTRAAQTLSMSQSAISHALKRLRDQVGEDLLVRSGNGVVPTARADALWPGVRQALAQLQQSLSPTAYSPQTHAADFRLAMADATAALLMPALIQSLESLKALANLRVLPLTTRDPRRLLDRSEADLAVGHFPEAVGSIVTLGADTPWRRARLYETEYLCVMRRDHPLAQGELTLDRYCEAHHLLVSFSGRSQGPIDDALTAIGRQRRIVLTVNQFFTAGRVVTRSDLLAVLPASFVAATGYRDELARRPLPLEVAPVTVDMFWHRRNDTAPAHHWLRERLAAAARQAALEQPEGLHSPQEVAPPAPTDAQAPAAVPVAALAAIGLAPPAVR